MLAGAKATLFAARVQRFRLKLSLENFSPANSSAHAHKFSSGKKLSHWNEKSFAATDCMAFSQSTRAIFIGGGWTEPWISRPNLFLRCAAPAIFLPRQSRSDFSWPAKHSPGADFLQFGASSVSIFNFANATRIHSW